MGWREETSRVGMESLSSFNGNYKVVELREICKDLGITGFTKYKKNP